MAFPDDMEELLGHMVRGTTYTDVRSALHRMRQHHRETASDEPVNDARADEVVSMTRGALNRTVQSVVTSALTSLAERVEVLEIAAGQQSVRDHPDASREAFVFLFQTMLEAMDQRMTLTADLRRLVTPALQTIHPGEVDRVMRGATRLLSAGPASRMPASGRERPGPTPAPPSPATPPTARPATARGPRRLMLEQSPPPPAPFEPMERLEVVRMAEPPAGVGGVPCGEAYWVYQGSRPVAGPFDSGLGADHWITKALVRPEDTLEEPTQEPGGIPPGWSMADMLGM